MVSAQIGSRWAPHLLSILRIMAGLLFMQHGTQKLLGFPVPPGSGMPAMGSLLWFGGIIELVGGALLTIGLLTRPVAFLASGMCAFAYFMFHAHRNFFPIVNQGELAALYSFVFLYFVAAGPGPWSVDARMGRTFLSRWS
ncbi:DoxX family protein [Enterovirga sp.]|jgi:putative oxidoreductase|uniref:DoxX family protein n=1 Tax=Enterovirga sp. TaxID=2026350 RepID=UPI0026282BBE|nr:DoxX family protein [Enterovirga sp.]MDB5589921.1 hypothetical protein [Enterovirga sp.]